MPDFGMWEAVVILMVVVMPCALMVALSPPVIRAALTEIRKAWHDAEPRPYVKDNHRDPDQH